MYFAVEDLNHTFIAVVGDMNVVSCVLCMIATERPDPTVLGYRFDA